MFPCIFIPSNHVANRIPDPVACKPARSFLLAPNRSEAGDHIAKGACQCVAPAADDAAVGNAAFGLNRAAEVGGEGGTPRGIEARRLAML